MNRLRVLVCGTNYGRSYVTALSRLPDTFELAGILARGSTRSRQVAAANGVPLYVDVRDVEKNIQLACAAMNSSAWPVVIKLLRRGVHVLCEHPQRSAALKGGISIASRHKIKFHLNGHFVDLPASRRFAAECSRLRKTAAPIFVQALATERSLYGLLDILKTSLGSVELSQIEFEREKGFCMVSGGLGRLPLNLLVQISGTKRGGHLPDGSPKYLFDYRVTVGFPDGVLTLMSMSGPVVWNPAPAKKGDRQWVTLYDGTTTREDLREQRIEANMSALESICRAILRGHSPERQRPIHILEVSQAWESIARKLYAA